jgi:predicted ArsR family transcriptional regulator
VQPDELLLRVLREAAEDTGRQGALTATEIAERLGWGYDRVRRFIGRLKAQGVVEVVRIWKEGIDDKPHLVSAYRLRTWQE